MNQLLSVKSNTVVIVLLYGEFSDGNLLMNGNVSMCNCITINCLALQCLLDSYFIATFIRCYAIKHDLTAQIKLNELIDRKLTRIYILFDVCMARIYLFFQNDLIRTRIQPWEMHYSVSDNANASIPAS